MSLYRLGLLVTVVYTEVKEELTLSHFLRSTAEMTSQTLCGTSQWTRSASQSPAQMPISRNSSLSHRCHKHAPRSERHRPQAFAFGGVVNSTRSLESQIDELEGTSSIQVRNRS